MFKLISSSCAEAGGAGRPWRGSKWCFQGGKVLAGTGRLAPELTNPGWAKTRFHVAKAGAGKELLRHEQGRFGGVCPDALVAKA